MDFSVTTAWRLLIVTPVKFLYSITIARVRYQVAIFLETAQLIWVSLQGLFSPTRLMHLHLNVHFFEEINHYFGPKISPIFWLVGESLGECFRIQQIRHFICTNYFEGIPYQERESNFNIAESIFIIKFL